MNIKIETATTTATANPTFTVYTYQPEGKPTLQPDQKLTTWLGFGKVSPTAWAVASAYAKEGDFALELDSQVRQNSDGTMSLRVLIHNVGDAPATPLLRVLFAEV